MSNSWLSFNGRMKFLERRDWNDAIPLVEVVAKRKRIVFMEVMSLKTCDEKEQPVWARLERMIISTILGTWVRLVVAAAAEVCVDAWCLDGNRESRCQYMLNGIKT